ncbi:MAG: hypothetical protein J6K15_01615, partial [Lachnospiraceae bacterium]|nr:hypothetical protein [Lachnospiraceae bacterium]
MKKKFMLRVMAWLLAVAMLLPSAGNLFTAYAEEGKVAYEGSITVKEAASWWSSKAVTVADLIGNVKPEDVDHIDFTGTDVFIIQYNNTTGDSKDNMDSEYYNPYTNQTLNAKKHTAKNIDFKNAYMFNICFSQATDIDCTVSWKVYTEPAADTGATGLVFDMTTNSTDFGGTNTIPASVFEACKGGAEITVDFEQETAEWWNLALQNDAPSGWANLNKYITSHESNSYGYLDCFSKGDKSITLTLSKEGVDEIVAAGKGLLFQVKSMKVTKATIVPIAPKATPTPLPTATPIPTPVPVTEETYKTVGDVLLVTEDMVKNGRVVIERAQYNSIIIPRTLDADVRLDTVKADEIVIEGG